MPDDKPTPVPGQLHTVKAGIFDAFFGNKGPNGELMDHGKPALLVDVPDTDDEDDD
jgi:hypothetical protein